MTEDKINETWDIPLANNRGVVLDEVCRDSEVGMICAALMKIASFPDRAAFIESDWMPRQSGQLIATELETFDIWTDDPELAEEPPRTIITEWIPAKADRLID